MPYSYCANKSITLLLSTGRQLGEEKKKKYMTGVGNISDIQSITSSVSSLFSYCPFRGK